MRRVLASTLAAVVLAMMTACPGNNDPDPGPTPSQAPSRIASTATVDILEPEAGAVVPAGDVRVRIRLEGGRIVEQVSTNLRPDEGHIHLLLDGELVELLGTLDETISGVEPGTHLLQVEFSASDHGPFSPRVIDAVTFTAE